MENIIRHTTEFAMHIVRAYVDPGDTVIDATCGNGNDTLALAKMDPAKLFAFDIQETAVRSTAQLLEDSGYREALAEGRFVVTQLGHENLKDFCEEHGCEKGSVSAVVFNLGYLPGGSKEITTATGTTLTAVQNALKLLAPNGLVCVTMYSGHPEGKREKDALLFFAEGLDAGKWHTAFVNMPNQKHDPPEILLITRKK